MREAIPEVLEPLRNALLTHAAAEADSIWNYEWIVDRCPDAQVVLLMKFMLEDERRHHSLFLQLAGDSSPSVPSVEPPGLKSANPAPLTESQTAGLLSEAAEEEHSSARAFQRMARKHKTVGDGLLSLFLELIATDCRKHERLLRYAAERLQRAGGSGERSSTVKTPG